MLSKYFRSFQNRFLSFFLLLTFLYSSAQPPEFKPAYDKMMRDADLQRGVQIAGKVANFTPQKVSASYNYSNNEYGVELKDGRKIRVTSQIFWDSTGRAFLFYANRPISEADSSDKRIFAFQTNRITHYFPVKNTFIEGIAIGDVWLFKVISGKLNVYSVIPELKKDNNYMNAIQIENNTIEPLNEIRLREIMQGNTKALKTLDKKSYYSAIVKYNED